MARASTRVAIRSVWVWNLKVKQVPFATSKSIYIRFFTQYQALCGKVLFLTHRIGSSDSVFLGFKVGWK
uniref:Putative voltage-dependent anion-selective channel n=1 Tax=Dolomedes sulfureus TaxID=492288 RepID=A0A0P0D5E5_9ARAC|nr:putative voltage-dependent anion-selective channel [Dolomedes sulfureus]